MDVVWRWKTWDDLSKEELYSLLRLRHQIFIIEQQCLYQHLDNFDQLAVHLIGCQGDTVVAHGRAFPPGTKSEFCSLSGICVAEQARGQGLGGELLKERIKYLETHFPGVKIVTSVQEYRVPVYQKLGFQTDSERYVIEGEAYLGDPIYHVDMSK